MVKMSASAQLLPGFLRSVLFSRVPKCKSLCLANFDSTSLNPCDMLSKSASARLLTAFLHPVFKYSSSSMGLPIRQTVLLSTCLMLMLLLSMLFHSYQHLVRSWHYHDNQCVVIRLLQSSMNS